MLSCSSRGRQLEQRILLRQSTARGSSLTFRRCELSNFARKTLVMKSVTVVVTVVGTPGQKMTET